MSDPLLLGIDLGTSSVKVLLVTAAGAVVASGSAEYPILAPQPGFAEQEPEEWWRAVQAAVGMALGAPAARAGSGRVAAIGLSGQMHGTVMLDQQRQLLAPAVIWPDQRSRPQVQAITAEIGAEQLVELSGSPIATGFMAATLRWLREERPALFASIGCVLQPKDWLRLRLTGELTGEPSDGSGALLLDVNSRNWSETLLNVVGLRAGQVPPLMRSLAVAGALAADAAEALALPVGLPVIAGAADTACGMLGAGATDPHTLIVNLSTGGQLVRPAAAPDVDRAGRIHTFCSALDPESGAGWYQMGAALCVGMALRWLRAQVLGLQGADAYERLTSLAAPVAPGAGGLLFLPYLVGERTPHMDPHARGAFLGLTTAHGQPELARAVLEGATFACYDAFQVLRAVGGEQRRVVLAGGGARSSLWQQIVADTFGVPVERLLVPEQSALGAALLAAGGVGLLDVQEAARAWARTGAPVEPDRSRHARYQELFALYQQAYAVNRELFHALGAV